MTEDLSKYDATQLPSPAQLANQRYVIVVSDWNSDITYPMAQGAYDTLVKHGVPEGNMEVVHVPGAVELTYAAAKFIRGAEKSHERNEFIAGAIIVIGCVIKGDTPHFDYVCSSVTQGVAMLNSKGVLPVIFSVLTTLDKQQALDRSGGKLGNKGIEGAVTAMRMANL